MDASKTSALSALRRHRDNATRHRAARGWNFDRKRIVRARSRRPLGGSLAILGGGR
jgi:hypothetical protein